MAFAVESIGLLFQNIGIFGVGMAFAIIAMVLAISRSMSDDKDQWALIFVAFAWLFCLIVPNIFMGGLIFGMGAIASMISFMPLLKKTGDKNIFVLAIIALILNLVLIIGTSAFTASISLSDNYVAMEQEIENITLTAFGIVGVSAPTAGLCAPNEFGQNDTSCDNDIVDGSFNPLLFVPFASILTIGTYIGKAVAFMGMVVLAPLKLSSILESEAYIQNTILLTLMSLIIIAWELAIFYKTVSFILNKRGMR